jgi:hypothetical protein
MSDQPKPRIIITGICKVCQWPFSYQIDFDAVSDPEYVDWCTECLNPPLHLKHPKCTPEEKAESIRKRKEAEAIYFQKQKDKRKKKRKGYIEDEAIVKDETLIYNQDASD